MRRLIQCVLILVTILVLAYVSSAQTNGEWVDCVHPVSGAKAVCFVPRRAVQRPAQQTTITQNQTNIIVAQQINVNTPVYVSDFDQDGHYRGRYVRSDNPRRDYYETRRYRETGLAEDQTDVPYYETQERRTVRRSYGGGIDRWSGRPYGHYEVQTEKVRVRAEANSLTFRPTIYIGTTYWPSSYYW
jgi:hypothetical protein